jgi:molybdenum cofactor cytidylyltransferase
MITAIVMASGYSKRMGENKLLIEFRGKPIIKWVLEALKNSKVDRTIVVTRGETILGMGREYGFDVVENNEASEGISASIRLGVEHAGDSDGYLFVAADQPFLSSELIDTLVDHFIKCPKCIVVPSYEGRRGNPVLFPSDLRADFLNLRGDTGGKAVISLNRARVESVEIEDEMVLVDIDTREEFERLIGK